jgi:hypothetical protein
MLVCLVFFEICYPMDNGCHLSGGKRDLRFICRVSASLLRVKDRMSRIAHAHKVFMR